MSIQEKTCLKTIKNILNTILESKSLDDPLKAVFTLTIIKF